MSGCAIGGGKEGRGGGSVVVQQPKVVFFTCAPFCCSVGWFGVSSLEKYTEHWYGLAVNCILRNKVSFHCFVESFCSFR